LFFFVFVFFFWGGGRVVNIQEYQYAVNRTGAQAIFVTFILKLKQNLNVSTISNRIVAASCLSIQ
jgi:hypothetical protein